MSTLKALFAIVYLPFAIVFKMIEIITHIVIGAIALSLFIVFCLGVCLFGGMNGIVAIVILLVIIGIRAIVSK